MDVSTKIKRAKLVAAQTSTVKGYINYHAKPLLLFSAIVILLTVGFHMVDGQHFHPHSDDATSTRL